MFATITTTLLAVKSKATIYLQVVAAILTGVATVLLRTFRAGQTAERLGRATTTLNQYKKEAKIEANIRSLGAGAARERLRKQWRKR